MNTVLQVGEKTFEPMSSASGGEYYNLSDLSSYEDDKILAFVDEGSFTIQLSEAIHGVTFTKQQQYLRYKPPMRWTTSAKVNAKGLASFNLFISQSKRLTNASMDPDSLIKLQARGLGGTYMELLRQLHARVSGQSMQEIQQPPLHFRGSRGFVARRKIESSYTLYMDALGYLYPAFADYAAKSELADPKTQPNRHRIAFPDAFAPYLREPSWDRLLKKLFGTRLPQSTIERLQPDKAPVALLAGAFLVRSIASPSELLDFEIEPFWNGKEGYRYLGEVRRVLRAVKAEHRPQILRSLRETPTKRFHELAKVISDATTGIAYGEGKYDLSGLESVQTWEQLCQQVAYIYHGQADYLLSMRQQEAERVKKLVDDSFCSLPSPHAVIVERGTLEAHSVNGKLVELIRVFSTQVAFSSLFAKPGVFARNTKLRELASELKRDGMAYSTQWRRLSLAGGELMLRRLVQSLDQSLSRHGVDRTPRNRTRLLVALLMFGSSSLKEKNSIPSNAWELIASDFDFTEVYSGFILNATVQQMSDFITFPAHTRVALTGYDPTGKATS